MVVLVLISHALVRRMIRIGTLDHPVERSSHTTPTPKGGGVGIVAATLLGSLAVAPSSPADRIALAGALALAAFSYLDDLRSRGFALKLAVQSAAACGAVAAGWRAADLVLPGLPALHLGAAGAILALGWMLFVTNAFNFIDGLNGLASGSALIATVALAAAGGPPVPALPLAAGIAGFLPLNYPRARIFMGDVGSQFCGFLLAAMAVAGAPTPRIVLILPLALAPILLDAAFTLLRRARAGERITQPHRGHLYQVAQRAGVPAWRVAAIYWAMAAWGAICGTLAGQTATARATPLAIAASTLPLLLWGRYTARKAQQAGITRW